MIEQIWLFHCGYISVPRGMFVKGGGLQFATMPFLSALAIHSERGPILIDAPFGHEGPVNAGDMLGTVLRSTGLTFRSEWAVVPRLEQLGFRPSEVEHVLMTHLHWDHTGGMKSIGHARFHMSLVEWEHANGLQGFDATRSGFAPGDFRALDNRVRTFTCERGARDLMDQAVDLFGDGSVLAIALPGHTPGGVGYLFDLAGRKVFHVGDAAFTVGQIVDGDDIGIFPRLAATDVKQTRSTLNALRRFHESNSDVKLVSSHDFVLGDECVGGPVMV